MKERMEVLDFKYKVVIFTLLFFFIISSLAPISGSDWTSYLIGKEGIINSINNISFNDGRIISGFLINFLTYNKFLFNLIFSVLMSLFVYYCNNLLGYVKNKYYYLFPFLGTILVSTFTFSYNYLSVTSTVTYTFPILMIFIYYMYLFKKETLIINIKELISLLLMAIYISLSSIHLSFIFLLGNIFFFFYFFKKIKESYKKYLLIIILQTICFIISMYFVDKTLFYNNIEISLANLSNYIDTIFSKNIILFLLGAIPINYYLNDKLQGNMYKRLLITLFDVILIFSLTYNFFYYSPVNLNLIINKYFGVFAVENWYYIFYFILYICLLFLSILHLIKNIKIKKFLIFLFTISFLSSITIFISPIWDEGTNIIVVLFIILAISVLLKEIEIKIYPKLLISFVGILALYYLSLLSITKYIDITREEYIKEQLKYEENTIVVKANPIYLIWRYNPTNIFQQKEFKNYYNIPQNKSLEVKYLGIFEKIEKKVKED